MCVCVCARVRACVRACVRPRELDGERIGVVTSRALAAVQTAVYVTGYSDCLTGFHEPPCHLINVTPV